MPVDPRAKLKESGLDVDDAKTLRLKVLSPAETAGLGHHELPSIQIPYFTVDGDPTSFYRLRYLDKPPQPTKGFAAMTEQKKFPKYIQAPGVPPRAYLPPFVDWATIFADPHQPVIITEGEFKSACATKYSLPTIGLGGVWSFRSKRFAFSFLPELEAVDWRGRVVYVIYDSDAMTNPSVSRARDVLCAELMKRGALPFVVDLPSSTNEAGETIKVGIDDYIVANMNGESFAPMTLESLIKTATSEEDELDFFCRRYGFVTSMNHVVDVYDGRLYPMDAFNNKYANKMIPNPSSPDKMITISQAWLRSPKRLTFRSVVVKPGFSRMVIPDDNETELEYNLWEGWGRSPVEGDSGPFYELLHHLFPADEEIKTVLDWFAYPLQNPGVKMPTALLLVGAQGTGKSLLVKTIADLYGPSATQLTLDRFRSSFNDWMEKGFVVWDEFSTGSQNRTELYDKLKDAITCNTASINRKFVSAYDIKPWFNMVFTSNYMDVLPLDRDDRRFIVLQSRARPKEQKFYEDYVEWLNNGGASYLFSDLLRRDLSSYHPGRHALLTDAKKMMSMLSHGDLYNWCLRLVEDPDSVLLNAGGEPLGWYYATTEELAQVYNHHNQDAKTSPQKLGRQLHRAGLHAKFPEWKGAMKVSGKKIRVYKLRPHDFSVKPIDLYKANKGLYDMAKLN